MKIIKLFRRAPKKNNPRPKIPTYDICITKKSSHGKKVYEKLGTYSPKGELLTLNIFRLCFWIAQDVSMSGNAARLFIYSGVLNLNHK